MKRAGSPEPSSGAGVAAAVAFALTTAWVARAEEAAWRIEGSLGAAASFDSTLTLDQGGAPSLEIDARWDNRSFESPLYYGLRVARQDAKGAWALRFVHLKVHLENNPPEVDRFAVSHGYNLLTVERSLFAGGFDLWAGLGLVIAHPESTVRGQTRPENEGGPFGGGYFLTGPTAALALDRRLRLGRRLALVPEARFTVSRARVPIAFGTASVPNVSLHVLVGLELVF